MKITFILIGLFSLYACGDKNVKREAGVIHLNPDEAQTLVLSDFFDHYEVRTFHGVLYSILLSFKRCDDLFVADLYGNPEGRLFVFNSQGDSLCRLGSSGRGPGEYLHLTEYYIDKNQNVVLFDGIKYVKYSLDGQLISDRIIEVKPPDAGIMQHVLNDSLLVFELSPLCTFSSQFFDKKYLEKRRSAIETGYKLNLLSIKDSSVQRTYFPYKACVDLYISDFSYIKDDTLCYFNTFDNCLYRVSEDTVVPRYYFDRGPYTTWTTIEEYEKTRRFREFGSIKFDETDRYIIGSYTFKNKSYNFIYNKSTDQTYNFARQINDDILEVNSSKYFSRWNIDDQYLSISIPPQLFIETIGAKKESMEADQWEIYKQQHRALIDAYETIDDESSDPIIIRNKKKK